MAENKPPERPAVEKKTYLVKTQGYPGYHLDLGKDSPTITPDGVELDEAQVEAAKAAARDLGVSLTVTEKKGD